MSENTSVEIQPQTHIYVDIFNGEPLVREAIARRIHEAFKDAPFKAVNFTGLEKESLPEEAATAEPSLFDYLLNQRKDLLAEHELTITPQTMRVVNYVASSEQE